MLNIKTRVGNECEVRAIVQTQVGRYLATTRPILLHNELRFEGVRASGMMDGVYPIPATVRVSPPYAVEDIQ